MNERRFPHLPPKNVKTAIHHMWAEEAFSLSPEQTAAYRDCPPISGRSAYPPSYQLHSVQR